MSIQKDGLFPDTIYGSRQNKEITKSETEIV